MTSSKPYIRKKAILVMYKIFLKFPDALRPAFPRLKDRLEDSDTGMHVMNVIDSHACPTVSSHDLFAVCAPRCPVGCGECDL